MCMLFFFLLFSLIKLCVKFIIFIGFFIFSINILLFFVNVFVCKISLEVLGIVIK